jgi:small subunit ribosomal protein S17
MARTFVGTVTSDKADKTIVVAVSTRKTHPIYKKQYSVTTKYAAHDEQNSAHMGDKVEITECRPVSARKHFTLTKIVSTATVAHVTEADAEQVAEVAGIAKKSKEVKA